MFNNHYMRQGELLVYTHSSYANPGSRPPFNTIREETPPAITPGNWPCYDVKTGQWVQIEDHRQEVLYNDASDMLEVKEVGPPPIGYHENPPEPKPPTEETLIKFALLEIDAKRVRPISSVLAAITNGNKPHDYDVKILMDLENQAISLRTKLARVS